MSFQNIHNELTAEGRDHRWIGLHSDSALAIRLQDEIEKRSEYPLLQEEKARGPRGPIGAKTRHDLFVHDRDGELLLHVVDQTDAVTPAGYDTLIAKLRDVIPTAKK